MSPAELKTLANVHGALAWVSAAALGAAWVAVWRRRVAGWAVAVAAVLGVATFATGVALHGPFQGRLRQRLFLLSETLGWLFERKEHAAFGALALTLSALFATWAERAAGGRLSGSGALAGTAGMGGTADLLRRAALLALGAAFVLSALAIGVSVAVGRRVGF